MSVKNLLCTPSFHFAIRDLFGQCMMNQYASGLLRRQSYYEQVQIVFWLIQIVDPNLLIIKEGDMEYTALHRYIRHPLCEQFDIGIIQQVLAKNTLAIFMTDKYLSTPLHTIVGDWAIHKRSVFIEVVKLFLAEFPDISKKHDRFGCMPLHIAAQVGAPVEYLKILVQANPDALKRNSYHLVEDETGYFQDDVSTKYLKHGTPLTKAFYSDDDGRGIKYLFSECPSATFLTNRDWTCLHQVLYHYDFFEPSSRLLERLRIILSLNPELIFVTEKRSGLLPIHVYLERVCCQPDLSVLHVLLSPPRASSCLRQQDYCYRTAYSIACDREFNNLHDVKRLLSVNSEEVRRLKYEERRMLLFITFKAVYFGREGLYSSIPKKLVEANPDILPQENKIYILKNIASFL